jgi:signal transduction histidine kinase
MVIGSPFVYREAVNATESPAGSSRLPDFIENNREIILQGWDEFARSLFPDRPLSEATVRDHAAEILAAIVKDMRTPETSFAQEEKGNGLCPNNSPALRDAGEEHAIARLSEQFNLADLVGEFRALRASVLRLWRTQHPGPSDSLDDIVRLNEAIDEALAASAQRYSLRLDEARTVIIGILAHDLRNPIHSAALSTRYILQSKLVDANCIKAAARIERAVTRMSALVGSLLDYARASLGDSIPVAPEATNMAVICAGAIEEVESAYPGKNIILTCPRDANGSWDAPRITQLLINVLTNAVQHGDSDAPIRVDVSVTVGSVLVQIHNEGVPIDPTALGTLFEPLYRRASDRSQTPKSGSSGLGLGLFISRQIALSHGGDIKVRSTHEEGTVFSIELPKSFTTAS